MIIDANKMATPDALDADICIMGGGAAGITLAKKLLNSKRRIILIESGNETYDQETQGLYKTEDKPQIFPSTLASRLRFLGGSSNHWENSTERFDPIDLKEREWVPNSGWPIEYDELSQFYPEAENYCGLDDNGYDLRYWESQFNFNNPISGSSIVNSAILKSAIPFTRFFHKHGNILKDSKYIKILTNANVTDIDYKDETIHSVTIETLKQLQSKVTAKIFVMCFGGIENARILLNFNQKYDHKLGNKYDNVGRYFMEHPTIRAANFYPLNGKLDKIYDGIAYNNQLITARFKLTEEAQTKNQTNNLRLILSKSSNLILSEGVSSAHVIKDSLKNVTMPDNFGSHLVNIIKDADLITESYLKNEMDSSFFESAYEFGGYQFVSMIEQTPSRDNRITLGNTIDKLNIKQVKINWSITDYDKTKAWKSLELLAKDPTINKLGRVQVLKDSNSRIWKSQLGFGHHHMGTTRMSSEYKKGVVDPSLRVFGTKNFYISGSSVFPTGGHVPPTLTIIALTLKLANELKQII